MVNREARGRHLVHDRPQALPRVRDRGPRRSGDGGGRVAVLGRVPRALVGGRVRPGVPGELRREAGTGGSWLLPGLSWFRPGLRRAVAVPEAFLTEKVGECLRRYLDELGVEVIPVASAALSRLKDRADLFVLPIFGSVRKGKEELHQVVQQLQERVHDGSGQAAPRRPPLDRRGREAVFQAFARIGLTFTAAARASAGGLRDGRGRGARACRRSRSGPRSRSLPDRLPGRLSARRRDDARV